MATLRLGFFFFYLRLHFGGTSIFSLFFVFFLFLPISRFFNNKLFWQRCGFVLNFFSISFWQRCGLVVRFEHYFSGNAAASNFCFSSDFYSLERPSFLLFCFFHSFLPSFFSIFFFKIIIIFLAFRSTNGS